MGTKRHVGDPPPNETRAEGPERRRHPRAAIELVVQLRFGSVDHFLQVHTSDLSKGGMFIRAVHASAMLEPHKVGEIVTLQFDAGGKRLVEGRAKVVRVVPDVGFGVEFIDLDDLSAQLIEAVVLRELGPS